MKALSAVPVLRVGDYLAAKAFWTALGFEVVEEGGDPARFGILRRDMATILIDAWHGPDVPASPGWRAYIRIDDAAAFADALDRAGIAREGPVEQPWGMREITVTDPSGNRVCFGMDA